MSEGKCRFNCRTGRESWIEGYRWAKWRTTAETVDDFDAEVAYRDYKRVRPDPRREGIRKTQESSKSNDVF